MSDHDNWQAWQHHDELLRQQRIEQILRAAERRPLEEEEIQILAIEAGVVQRPHNPN